MTTFLRRMPKVRSLFLPELGRGSMAPRVDRNDKVTSGGSVPSFPKFVLGTSYKDFKFATFLRRMPKVRSPFLPIFIATCGGSSA